MFLSLFSSSFLYSLTLPSFPLATRDAISKALYDRLFRWVVSQINHLLAPSLEEIAWGNDIGIYTNCSIYFRSINALTSFMTHLFVCSPVPQVFWISLGLRISKAIHLSSCVLILPTNNYIISLFR